MENKTQSHALVSPDYVEGTGEKGVAKPPPPPQLFWPQTPPSGSVSVTHYEAVQGLLCIYWLCGLGART